MKGIPFIEAVPTGSLVRQRSRTENPLRDALLQLHKGGRRPDSGETTGQGMMLNLDVLEMSGQPLTVSRVQGEVNKLHFGGHSDFFAEAQPVNGVRGNVRVYLVTRERFEQIPSVREANTRAKHAPVEAQESQ